MSRRKERIRKGLEIDFDLLDSDMVRCHLISEIDWKDGPRPFLLWLDSADEEDWSEGQLPKAHLVKHDMHGERELAEGLRILRLMHYKSYACLAELATRRTEKGEFVIRRPPDGGYPRYVFDLDEACLPAAGRSDPDELSKYGCFGGFRETPELAQAQRFSHAEAVRLTIRIMEVLGYDIPGDRGDYYEPMRADVAEELHMRALRRPRRLDPFFAMLVNLEREPWSQPCPASPGVTIRYTLACGGWPARSRTSARPVWCWPTGWRSMATAARPGASGCTG